jgi:poly(3-hydroxybutyrate) depolymerase
MRGIALRRSSSGTRWRAVLVAAAVATGGFLSSGAWAAPTSTSPAAVSAQEWRPAPLHAAGRDTSYIINHAGMRRHYIVFEPSHPAASPGLLIFLHGHTHTGADMETMTELDKVAGQLGHYVIYPYGEGGTWNFTVCCPPATWAGTDDFGFIDAIVKSARARYHVAARKVLVGGTSGGADFVFQYACNSAVRIGGIFASVGNSRFAICPRTQPVHVLAINGVIDERNGWQDGKPAGPKMAMDTWSLSNGCGPGWSAKADSRGNVLRTAQGCRKGASIEQWVAKKLDHRWVASNDGANKYAFNSTATVWNWAKRIMAKNESGLDPVPATNAVAAPVRALAPVALRAPALVTFSTTTLPATGGVVQVVNGGISGVPGAYRLFVPAHPAAHPQLLVVLHGENSTASQVLSMTNLDKTVGAKGHYILYPEGSFNNWNAGECCGTAARTKSDDLHRLDAIIKYVTTSHPTIGSKIAIGGFGAGGIMAYHYSCNGAVPVSEVFSVAGVPLMHCVQPRPLNVLAINGVKDQSVYWHAKNTSPMFVTGTGTTENLTNVFSGLLGAWYYNEATAPLNVLRRTYGGTYPGYSMQSVVAYKLDHRWTSTDAQRSQYGVNATAEVSSFLLNRW